MRLTRRALFAAPLLQMGADGTPGWGETLHRRAAALGGRGLLQSYDVSGGAAFDRTQAGCAYVYDNAVAGLALLAIGERALACRIADALVHAQAHDRFWRDGRLRNAYRAGPMPSGPPAALPGWWDADANRWLEDGYQVGSATGVLAWAMLLWIALGAEYRAAAERCADWIEISLRGPQGYAGGFIGFEPAPTRLSWVSTEHNIDLAAAFRALGRGDAAAHAEAFVASMWQPAEGRFATGLKPDGSLNLHSAVDANLWPLLAFPNPEAGWPRALDWILSRHGLPANGPVREIQGVDFNDDRDGIWLEGTAIAALVARQHRPEIAAHLLATLAAQTSPNGLIYACTTPTLTTGLSTGLDTNAPDFLYFRRPHLAPTAWAVLASSGGNPFRR